MDDWGWQELQPWLERRLELPVGPLFCVINGATGGRPWATAAARAQLRRTAAAAGVRRRFAPHQLRHAHAVEMAREGVPLIVIQRQLGHSNLGITSVYLQGIDNAEIIETVHARRAPMIPVSASLRLCSTKTKDTRSYAQGGLSSKQREVSVARRSHSALNLSTRRSEPYSGGIGSDANFRRKRLPWPVLVRGRTFRPRGESGGSAGSREPRRPRPDAGSGSARLKPPAED